MTVPVSDNILGNFPLVRVLTEEALRANCKDNLLCESPKRVFFFEQGIMFYWEK